MSNEINSTSAAAGTRSKPCDAFLSYAHEDLDTVEWLGRLLTSYWIPGRKQRRIFRDRDRITAGGLGLQIFVALEFSRYLIVCCSEHTAESTWVPQEVEAFLKDHQANQVLVCRVGHLSELPQKLPPFLEALWTTTPGSRPFIPDLRGYPERAKGREERRRYREEALALLAPLVGLADKDEVLARRVRRLWRLAIAAGITAITAIASLLVWTWWLTTSQGRFFDFTRSLSAEIGEQEVDDPHALLPAARALGRLDRRDLLERYGLVTRDSSFQALFLAMGYASLPQPDCSAVGVQLAGLDAVAAQTNPVVPLLAEARCTINPGPPREDLLPSTDGDRASLLARAGFHRQAVELVRNWQESPAELLPSLIDVTLAVGEEVGGDSEEAINAWIQGQEAFDSASQALDWLEQFEQKGLLGLPLARRLLPVAREGLTQVAPDFANSWDLRQQLAAHLVLVGNAAAARELIATTDPQVIDVATPLVYEDAELGWAWRGLALARLGDFPPAEAAFDKAAAIATRPTLRSPTYENWEDLAAVFALADDWRRAFDTFHELPDGRARVKQGMKLIELWEAEKTRNARPSQG
jgi:tetratricopeptide (TPR) repeat protein